MGRPWYARNRTMKLKLFAAFVLAVAAAACGGVVSPSSNKQDNFTLQVAPGGSASQNFNVSSGGSLEYSIFVTSATPTPPQGLGVALGQVVSGQCGLVQSGLFNQYGHTTLAGQIQPGEWCVIVFDPYGTYTAIPFPSTVTVVGYVSHP